MLQFPITREVWESFEPQYFVFDRDRCQAADENSKPEDCNVQDAEGSVVFGEIENIDMAWTICNMLNNCELGRDAECKNHWLQT